VEKKRNRATMKATSEAVRGWPGAIAQEIAAGPGVTFKSGFGMTLAYREGVVLAALPKTGAHAVLAWRAEAYELAGKSRGTRSRPNESNSK
jgi:hypothetical protein